MKDQLDCYRDRRRGPNGKEPAQFYDLFYPDDVARVMSFTRRERLLREAWAEGDDFEEGVTTKGLGTTREKSSNMLMAPNETTGTYFWLSPDGHIVAAMSLKAKELRLTAPYGGASGAEAEEDIKIHALRTSKFREFP